MEYSTLSAVDDAIAAVCADGYLTPAIDLLVRATGEKSVQTLVNRTDVLRLLVEKGVTPNQLLEFACYNGYPSMVKAAVELGAKRFHLGLWEACKAGDVDLAEMMIQYMRRHTDGKKERFIAKLAKESFPRSRWRQYYYSESVESRYSEAMGIAVTLACGVGSIPLVTLLIKKGALVSSAALSKACLAGNLPLVRLLCETGESEDEVYRRPALEASDRLAFRGEHPFRYGESPIGTRPGSPLRSGEIRPSYVAMRVDPLVGVERETEGIQPTKQPVGFAFNVDVDVDVDVNKSSSLCRLPTRLLNIALPAACEGAHRETILYLIEQGASAFDHALGGAYKGGDSSTIDFIIGKDVCSYDRALVGACANGDPLLVRRILSTLAGECDPSGDTAVEHPIKVQPAGLDVGGPAAVAASKKRTPFDRDRHLLDEAASIACQYGHLSIFEMLLPLGRINLNSCLHYACLGGHTAVVQRLLDLGADDINYGLYGAAAGGHIPIAQTLIEKGATNLCEAVVSACTERKREMVVFLLGKGIPNLQPVARVWRTSGLKDDLWDLLVKRGMPPKRASRPSHHRLAPMQDPDSLLFQALTAPDDEEDVSWSDDEDGSYDEDEDGSYDEDF